MSIELSVDSYFEYFLTLLSWVISNQLWTLITQTGIVVLPFAAILISTFIKAREQGDDEGNKGRLLANWLENSLYVSILVLIFTCVPLFNVSLNTIALDTDRMTQCGKTVIQAADTGLGKISSELNGETARLPLWWAFMHSISKGVTHGAIATIPCSAELRQLRFDVQHTRITDQQLVQEIVDFAGDCYLPAKAKLKRQQVTLTEAQARDVDWLGSSLLLTTAGLYDSFYSQFPRKQWAYDSTRDGGRPNNGDGGYPSCASWWADGSIGLRARLIDSIDASVWTQVQTLFSGSEAETQETIIRSVIRPENISASNGNTYRGYTSYLYADNRGVFDSVGDAVSRTVGGVGATATSFLSAPGFDVMRQSLPMVQGMIALALVILIPIITVMSGYNIKTIITLSFAQFAVFFLSFWWELARWIDGWFMRALYESPTNSNLEFNVAGLLEGGQGNDSVFEIIIATMFFLLPAFWFGAMSWTGFRIGGAVSSAISNASGKTQSAGDMGTSMAKTVVTKGKG